MSDPTVAPPPVLAEQIASPSKALRKLFLTLFLRGRGARGLNKQNVPKSVGQRLALISVIYGLFGMVSLSFRDQPVFALAVYLHGMTFVFLGMFIASSAGEILFNKEEADILLHRPISPKVMLWAKVRVLVEVSLWLAFAFNLTGLIVGTVGNGGWLFLPVHLVSIVLEAIFCASSMVLLYQLCLRWLGRDRLEGLMTTAQVLISVAAVMSGQILPRVMFRAGNVLNLSDASWWIRLLPPAWFAGLDDAVTGTSSPTSWLMAAMALVATGTVVWLAFGRLAQDYEVGLQNLIETSTPRRKSPGRERWLSRLVAMPPLSWWLRNPVSRASFLLTVAYMFRDRETKLRLYPGISPIIIMPLVMLFQPGTRVDGGAASFFVPFVGCYIGMLPMLTLQLLQFSQQWQAADIFQVAPMRGPADICHGARRAVMLFIVFPAASLTIILAGWVSHDLSLLLMTLPGLTLLPLYSLVPAWRGKGVPLSQPIDSAKAASRGPLMMLTMILSFLLAFLTSFLWTKGYFWSLEFAVLLVSSITYAFLRSYISQQPWPSAE